MSGSPSDILASLRNAVELTTQPRLSQLLTLLIEHDGLTVDEATPLLGLPRFMTALLTNRLVDLGYATRMQAKDKRHFATIAGLAIDGVMRTRRLR